MTLSYLQHLFFSVWRKEKLLRICFPGLVRFSLHSLSHTDIAEGTAGSGGLQKNSSGCPSDILVFLRMELVLVTSKTCFEILGSSCLQLLLQEGLNWDCFPGEDNSAGELFLAVIGSPLADSGNVGRSQRFVRRSRCLDVNPVFGMQIGVPGIGLGCKSRRLKEGKPPEMLVTLPSVSWLL